MSTAIPTAVASDLEKAALDLLTSDGCFSKVDVGRTIGNLLNKPGCNFAVVEGPFEIMGSQLKQRHKLVAMLVVQHIRVDSELERRRLMHPLVQWLAVRLHGETLGLPIQALAAELWREITTKEQLESGVMTAEVEFTTKSSVPLPDPDANAAALTQILASFNEADSGTPLETSQTDLPGV